MDDIARGGHVYSLLWGRSQNRDTAEKMAELVGANVIVTGHQSQETGWKLLHPNMLILACDHNHGMLICVDLARAYKGEELEKMLIPLAGIV
jgi:hypothetical protein